MMAQNTEVSRVELELVGLTVQHFAIKLNFRARRFPRLEKAARELGETLRKGPESNRPKFVLKTNGIPDTYLSLMPSSR